MKTTKEWKKYHQLSLSILKQLGFGAKSTMESRILTELQFITDYALKQNGASFNPRELLYLSTTNIIMNIVFGRRRDYNLGMTDLAVQVRRGFDNLDPVLDVAPLLRFLPYHRNILLQQIDCQKMLQEILRVEIEKSAEVGADDCFVRRYVERVGEDYDHDQLRFTIRDLVGAGTDTTANALRWFLIVLANYQDVQNRLRAEIDAAVPRGRLPSLNDQSKLPFVDATILEILRWRPLVPLALPHMSLCDTNVGDFFIPAGTLVSLSLYIPITNIHYSAFRHKSCFSLF